MSLAPPHLPGSYLVVELTNRCSLACVHCSVSEQGHAHHSTTGYLDPTLFDALVDDLIDVGARYDALILFWLGEPLLHPHFTRIHRKAVRAAATHGTFGQVEVHTNGTHLTAARTAALLRDGPTRQVLHLSLDAATAGTYHAVKGLDRYALVDDNVARLIQHKGQTGARWPRVVLQYIVGSNNVHEVRPFAERWTTEAQDAGLDVISVAGQVPAGDEVVIFFRQLDCPTPELQERENAVFRNAMLDLGLTLPAAADKGTQVAAENLTPCSGFWKSPVVGWQGDVTTCTRDNLLHNRLGTLRTHRFRDLWHGPTNRSWRAQVARGDYTGLELCATCFIPRSLNHTELSPADIAAQAAWDATSEAEAAR